MQQGITVLGLFDGISCGRVALERAGIPIEKYYACEIDKHAIAVSKANHPDIIHIGDIKGIHIEDGYIFYNQNNDPMKNGGSFPNKIDLVLAGFPCQSFSIAGSRKGFDDDRGNLFFDLMRIMKQVKPTYFLFENVASMKKEHRKQLDEMIGVKSIEINSSLLSAQQRKRLYWCNWKVEQPEDKGILLKDVLEDGEVDKKHYIKETSLSTFTKNGKIKGLKSLDEKSNTLLASCYKGFGNDGTTCIKIGQLSFNFDNLIVNKLIRIAHFNKGGQGDRIYSTQGKSVSLSALGGGRGAKTGLYAIAQRGRNIVDGKRKDVLGAETEQRFETSYSEKANTLTSVQKDSLLLEVSEATKKGYCEIPRNCGVDLTQINSKTRRGRKMENKSNCLMAGGNEFYWNNGYTIRKLTVKECCKLQTLPDDYFIKDGEKIISDSQAYKCIGNGWTVDAISHILKGIIGKF